MRISDWSADVCSSDLAERGTRHARRRDRALPDPAGLPGPHRARTHGVAQGVSAPRPAAEGGFGIGDWGFEGAFRSPPPPRHAPFTPPPPTPPPQPRPPPPSPPPPPPHAPPPPPPPPPPPHPPPPHPPPPPPPPPPP